jgi:hypothetical protein
MKTETNLPESCYGILLVDSSLIIINVLESGYRKVAHQPDNKFLEHELGKRSMKNEGCGVGAIRNHIDRQAATSDFANQLNAEKGVTIQQRKAMEWGSQFGWSHGLSNPDNYDNDGRPYSASNPKK